ncbi:hypothetical protein CRUP_036370, partial [Coryphaenoides rupestris]
MARLNSLTTPAIYVWSSPALREAVMRIWTCPCISLQRRAATMLSNTSGVPLSVDFDSPEDFFVFIFHILFATSSVLVAGSVVIAIFSTKGLRAQNRFIFMLNTSISDTLTGLSVYYLGLFDVQEGYPSRNGTYYILPSFLGVNVLTFLFAQFDRYFA